MKLIRFLLLAVLLVAVSLIIFFIPALLQEDNPGIVIISAAKLHLTGNNIIAVNNTALIQRQGDEQPLTEYLSSYGWTFTDRLGSAIVYTQADDQITVTSRQWTRYYVIYQLPKPVRSLISSSLTVSHILFPLPFILTTIAPRIYSPAMHLTGKPLPLHTFVHTH